MKFVADVHLHSHFSRATSKNLNLEHLSKWAQLKGVHVVGTGDIAHPGWLAEMRQKLQPAEDGLFRLKDEFAAPIQREVFKACHGTVRFMLAGEISNIYKKHDKVRKIHNVVFFPTFDAVEKFQGRLEKIGNIRADGRPILGLDSRDLLEIVLETDPRGYLIPAHIWTPWFALFGSMSGFDSIEECFEDLTPHIFALETGLSSDPPMNWRLSALDKYVLVSNSDAHSPPKLAREANVFDTELSYSTIFEALKTGDPNAFLGTIEFFPEEGKYHFDGHRKCNVRWAPKATIEHDGICPQCGSKVTVGVMHRVEALADRAEGEKPPTTFPYISLIPLPEVLAEIYGVGVNTKRVNESYEVLLTKLGPELHILQNTPLEELEKFGGSLLVEGIRRMRCGELRIAPGYDGEYGTIRLFEDDERARYATQLGFFAEQIKASKEAAAKQSPKVSDEIASGSFCKTPPEERPGEAKPQEPRKSGAARDAIVEDLNPEQREAVKHLDGPLLILAGPGTGKTRTLTQRLAYLVQEKNVNPVEILAIAFTNKAAQEVLDRLRRLVGEKTADEMTIKTFHALGLQILKNEGAKLGLPSYFGLCSETDRLSLFRALHPALESRECHLYLNHISLAKGQLLGPETCQSAPASAQLPEFSRYFQAYQSELARRSLLDYDDLILLPVQLFETHPEVARTYQERFRWISVDEYQDINLAQYRLLRCLVGDSNNLCVIGDPDQAIYGFRGASKEFFLKFERDFPRARTLRLSRNYRSSQIILDASSQIIAKSALPIDRQKIWSDLVAQNKIEIYHAPTDKAEAEFVVHEIEKIVGGTSYFSLDSGRVGAEDDQPQRAFSDFAVWYRMSALNRELQVAFKRSGIPYQTVGETAFFERELVSELLNYLWFLHDPHSNFHLEKLLASARCGLGAIGLKKVSESAQNCETSLWEVLRSGHLLSALGLAHNKTLINFIKDLSELLNSKREGSLPQLIEATIELFYPEAYFTTEEARAEQLSQLILRARPFENRLREFLEYSVLEKETDAYDPRADKVTLMTLHSAKGLEFPVVFIVGCEEGLLPFRKDSEAFDLEEERRLFYVGMTRAKERLILSRAGKRFLFGKTQRPTPSRFLNDIETSLKEAIERATPRGAAETKDKQLQLF